MIHQQQISHCFPTNTGTNRIDYESCNYFYSYVQSWVEKRDIQSEKANLIVLFERYVPVLIDANRSGRFKKITPIQEVEK